MPVRECVWNFAIAHSIWSNLSLRARKKKTKKKEKAFAKLSQKYFGRWERKEKKEKNHWPLLANRVGSNSSKRVAMAAAAWDAYVGRSCILKWGMATLVFSLMGSISMAGFKCCVLCLTSVSRLSRNLTFWGSMSFELTTTLSVKTVSKWTAWQ